MFKQVWLSGKQNVCIFTQVSLSREQSVCVFTLVSLSEDQNLWDTESKHICAVAAPLGSHNLVKNTMFRHPWVAQPS